MWFVKFQCHEEQPMAMSMCPFDLTGIAVVTSL